VQALPDPGPEILDVPDYLLLELLVFEQDYLTDMVDLLLVLLVLVGYVF
jgi:hypothetical protein